ncbi:MAG: amidohydrolase, partial [Burkholderia sp.]|nr:amidohydrolase [Burkholderia sp.]
MDTISIKRRRLLGAAAASLALPAFAETPAHDGASRMTTQSNYLAVRPDWLASALEPALEPGLPIVDAHHHFYERPGWIYMLDDYLQDARSGHNIQASVYMQAQTRYRDSGPAELKPVGETAYVA